MKKKIPLWWALVAIILIFATWGIYYLKSNRQHSAPTISLAEQQECHTAGENAYKADSEMYSGNGYLMMEPEYAYNSKLNTCLYYGGYTYNNPSSGQCGDILKHSCDANWERWVKNSFTNATILDVTNFTDPSGNWMASSTQLAAKEAQEEALMANTQ